MKEAQKGGVMFGMSRSELMMVAEDEFGKNKANTMVQLAIRLTEHEHTIDEALDRAVRLDVPRTHAIAWFDFVAA